MTKLHINSMNVTNCWPTTSGWAAAMARFPFQAKVRWKNLLKAEEMGNASARPGPTMPGSETATRQRNTQTWKYGFQICFWQIENNEGKHHKHQQMPNNRTHTKMESVAKICLAKHVLQKTDAKSKECPRKFDQFSSKFRLVPTCL